MFGLFKSKKKDKSKSEEGFLGGQIGSFLARNEAQATGEALKGMGIFSEAAKNLTNVKPEISQGNLFEIIESTKFNMDAATKSSPIRAYTTASMGLPHDKADILIKDGNNVLREVQAKSSGDPAWSANEFRGEKYSGMQRLTNADKAQRVKDLSEKRASSGSINADNYRDSSNNITSELKHGEVSSGGTTYDEALSATKDHETYRRQFEMSQFKQEIKVTAKEAAQAGAIMGGAMSTIKNSVALYRGDISTEEMVGNVVVDTTKAGIRSGATGGLGAGIRVTAEKAGINALAKSNVATAVASGVIDVGVTVYNFAKGEINSEEAMEQIGQKGFSTMSSIYAGATAGLVFGPAGVLVGSMAGYLAASNVYQTCLEIFKNGKLQEEEARRVIALCEAASAEMRRQRAEFEMNMEGKLQLNKRIFDSFLTQIDRGLFEMDHQKCLNGVVAFADYLGHELKLAKFEDFDQHMKMDNDLVL
ncbi:MAG: hypothetical protein AB2421_17450 [Thermotaleaceae bacterium]